MNASMVWSLALITVSSVYSAEFDLVRKYAPIVFFHSQERHLPTDVAELAEETLVYGAPPDSIILSTSIGDVNNLGRPSYWLEIARGLESRMEGAKGRKRKRIGLAHREVRLVIASIRDDRMTSDVDISIDYAAADLERMTVGADPSPQSPYDLASAYASNATDIVCYYHVEQEVYTGWDRGGPLARYAESRIGEPVGSVFDIIYYSFFHRFNEFTNNHEGDWDSAIAVLIPRDVDARPLIVYFSHHSKLLFHTRGVDGSGQDCTFTSFVRSNIAPQGKSIGSAYLVKDHPVVFSAYGSHAAYPFPGVTLTGPDLNVDLKIAKWNAKVSFGTDVHNLGKGYLPEGFRQDLLEDQLKDAIKGSYSLKPMRGNNWSKFPGKWGEASRISGWGGSPSFHRSNRMSTRFDGRRVRLWLEQATPPIDQFLIIWQSASDARLHVH